MDNKIRVFTDSRCSGCQQLKKTITELGLKEIEILEFKEHLEEAEKLKVFAVPTAVINNEKYNILREDNCLIFKNKKSTVKVCKKQGHLR